MPVLVPNKMGDLKEFTPAAVRVVEYSKQAGKRDTTAYKHPIITQNFIAYRAHTHPKCNTVAAACVLGPGAAELIGNSWTEAILAGWAWGDELLQRRGSLRPLPQ